VTAWEHHALLVKSSWGLAHPISLTELALLDGRTPLFLWDIIGLTLTLICLSSLEVILVSHGKGMILVLHILYISERAS
jgi:hypothetical protein